MKRRIAVGVIILIIFAGLLWRYAGRAPKRDYSDFRVYYTTGQRFLAKKDIYARPDESITPFKYSPLFAMLISPLSFFSKKVASLIFFAINFILLIIAFVYSERLIVRDKISFGKSVFLYCITAVSSLRFILHTLDSGQVGIIMFTPVVLGLYLLDKKKDTVSAFSLGLSVMIKYMSFAFLPYFFFRKKMKLVFLALLFIALYCFAPIIYSGFDTGLGYLKNWIPSITRTSFYMGSWYDNKNQSLFSLILRYFTKCPPYDKVSIATFHFNYVLIASFAIAMSVYLLISFPYTVYHQRNTLVRRSLGEGGDDGRRYIDRNFEYSIDYSLLFVFMALFNPNGYIHNFVVFVFIYMTLFHYLMKIKFKDRLALTLVILSFSLTTLTSELFVGDKLETLFEKLSLVTIAGLILAFLLFGLKWGRRRVY